MYYDTRHQAMLQKRVKGAVKTLRMARLVHGLYASYQRELTYLRLTAYEFLK